MDATAAVMIFLSCVPGTADCREMQGAQPYDSATICREELPSVLESMNRMGRNVIGRCALASDFDPDLDRITTASVSSGALISEGHVIVRVTRLKDGIPETTSYQVPQSR